MTKYNFPAHAKYSFKIFLKAVLTIYLPVLAISLVWGVIKNDTSESGMSSTEFLVAVLQRRWDYALGIAGFLLVGCFMLGGNYPERGESAGGNSN